MSRNRFGLIPTSESLYRRKYILLKTNTTLINCRERRHQVINALTQCAYHATLSIGALSTGTLGTAALSSASPLLPTLLASR